MTYYALIGPNDPRRLAANADRPFFFNRNILERSQSVLLPRWNISGDFAHADVSRAGSPAYRAVDGLTNAATMIDPALDANFATTTDLYLCFSVLPSYKGSPNHADGFQVWIPNLLELVQNSINFDLQYSNLSDFSSSFPIAHFNLGATAYLFGSISAPNFDRNGRAYAWDLADPIDSAIVEYFQLRYLRLHFSGPAGVFNTHQPQVLEVMLGPKTWSSRAMSPPTPESLLEFEPLIGEFMSASGQRSDLVFAESRTAISPSWSPFPLGAEADPQSGAAIDNADAFRQAYRKAHHGTRSFVFVMNSTTKPQLGKLYHLEKPVFAIMRPDAGHTVGTLKDQRWLEQGPFVDDEEPDEVFSNARSLNFTIEAQAFEIGAPIALDGYNAMTWSCWISPYTSTLHTTGVLFQKSNGTNTPFSVNLLRSGSSWDTVQLVVTDGTTGAPGPGAVFVATIRNRAGSPHPLDPNVWHHIAVTYQRSPDGIAAAVCQIDVDGIAQTVTLASGSATAGAIMASTYPLTIGAAVSALSYGSTIGPAFLDEAAIFNAFYDHYSRAIWLYNLGRPRPLALAPALLSWWRWEQDLFDYGPTGNAGVLINGLGYTTEHA